MADETTPKMMSYQELVEYVNSLQTQLATEHEGHRQYLVSLHEQLRTAQINYTWLADEHALMKGAHAKEIGVYTTVISTLLQQFKYKERKRIEWVNEEGTKINVDVSDVADKLIQNTQLGNQVQLVARAAELGARHEGPTSEYGHPDMSKAEKAPKTAEMMKERAQAWVDKTWEKHRVAVEPATNKRFDLKEGEER